MAAGEQQIAGDRTAALKCLQKYLPMCIGQVKLGINKLDLHGSRISHHLYLLVKAKFLELFKAMILTTKQIIEKSNDTAEIKGVGEQFAAIQQSLEKAVQSQDARIPEEALRDLLSIYDLYLYIEAENNPSERLLNRLEELERSLEEFKTKYKDFAPKEAIDGIENVQVWAKISRTMMSVKVYALAASVEDNELKQLRLFYTGLINLLDIAENHLIFFTERGRELAKALAQTAISDKTVEDYAKKRPVDEITSQAIGIRTAAKAILWEIDRHENKDFLDKFSYKALYEKANNAVKTEQKEELLKTLRSWREEYVNELEKRSDN